MARKWHNPDVLVANGDLIEGRQDRQGGAELITNDRNVQSDMAVEALRLWSADRTLISYGTQYHVSSQAEDFEYNIAERIGADIGGHLYFTVEGMTIDARHKIGSSSIPHGRGTALLRESMWNLMRYAMEEAPKANIIVRSHVHYHIWIEQPGRIMFTTPGLQLSRGRYGSRECTGETHWGAIRLIIDKGQIVQKEVKIWNLRSNAPQTIKIR